MDIATYLGNSQTSSAGSASAATTASTRKKDIGALNQEDFMKLMLQQLKSQDPFKPTDNTQFIAQMAQLSSVTGISEMKNSLVDVVDSLRGSQMLSASSLLGREVLVEADTVTLAAGDEGLVGQLDLEKGATSVDIEIRNSAGAMVPLGAMMTIEPTFGPAAVGRYNSLYTADFNGAPKPGFSSGEAQAEMEKILKETLPRGMGYEWTDLVYQEKIAGNTMVYIFPLCVLLVFLVLAAQYESWTLPLAIILIVPMCILSAVTGVWLSGFFGQPDRKSVV